jgi:hypothetical protein
MSERFAQWHAGNFLNQWPLPFVDLHILPLDRAGIGVAVQN